MGLYYIPSTQNPLIAFNYGQQQCNSVYFWIIAKWQYCTNCDSIKSIPLLLILLFDHADATTEATRTNDPEWPVNAKLVVFLLHIFRLLLKTLPFLSSFCHHDYHLLSQAHPMLVEYSFVPLPSTTRQGRPENFWFCVKQKMLNNHLYPLWSSN